MVRYLAYGLVIDSDIEPPGAVLRPEASVSPADLEIRFGAATIDPAARELGPYRFLGDRLLFTARGVAGYLCEAGCKIVVDPAPGADAETVQAFLIATALPAILWMRGRLVLHATAAVLPDCGSAIAVAARSGGGKSTILAELLARGARAVADDTVAVALGDNVLTVSGLPAAYFRRAGDSDQRERVMVAPEHQVSGAELAAIFLLVDRSEAPPPVVFERLRPAAAVERLLASRHRPRIPFALGVAGRVLKECALLANTVPIYLWRRQDGSPGLGDAEFAALLGHAGR